MTLHSFYINDLNSQPAGSFKPFPCNERANLFNLEYLPIFFEHL